MTTLTSVNNIPFIVGGTMRVGIYPHPVMPVPLPRMLDLAKRDALAVLVTGEESVKDVDAAVTTNAELTLGIRTRDCAPICICDGKKIGIAHVGWPGYALNLTEKFMSYFDMEKATVYVGPFLHSFEIQKDFCYEALMKKPEARPFIREEDGKIIFYFQDALAALLPEQAVFDTRNTGIDLSLPSYRRAKESVGFVTAVSFA